MAFQADQFGALLAQKLATSLMLDAFTAEKLPYLVVLSDKTDTDSVKSINETDKLSWLLNPEQPLLPSDVMNKLSQTTVRFDTVESYNASYSGSVAQHKMFSGDVVTDNMNIENPNYNLSAKVSHTSTLSSHSVAQTVDILKEAFFLKFPVFLSLPDITNVESYGEGLASYGAKKEDIYGLITSLDISRDSSIQDGFNIQMVITQTKFAEAVTASDTVGLVTDVSKLAEEKALEQAFPSEPNSCTNTLAGQLVKLKAGVSIPSDGEVENSIKAVRYSEGKYANAEKCNVSELMKFWKNAKKQRSAS